MNKHLYIVEGKDDVSRLKAAGARFVMTTEGFLVSNRLKGFLKNAQNIRGIVLLLDPDGPGNKIREELHHTLSAYEDVFIDKAQASARRKIGVAEADTDYIKEALAEQLKADEKSGEKETFSLSDVSSLGLTGQNSALKKEKLKRKYSLVITTAKSIADQLSILRITPEEIGEFIHE
jgi:ribonuclease M5